MFLFYKQSFIAFNETNTGVPEITTKDFNIGHTIDALINDEVSSSVINTDEQAAIKYLKKRFRYVRAAGGVVRSYNNQWLLIRRNGFWDLPKGMIEINENTVDAALREVREETGIDITKDDGLLTHTFHIYNIYGDWTMKETWWYKMICEKEGATKPQLDEGIVEATWFSKEERHSRLGSSFASMRYIDQILCNQGF